MAPNALSPAEKELQAAATGILWPRCFLRRDGLSMVYFRRIKIRRESGGEPKRTFGTPNVVQIIIFTKEGTVRKYINGLNLW